MGKLEEIFKIQIDIACCKYCGSTAVLINDYGECPKGCPGYFTICNTFNLELPPDKIKQIREHFVGLLPKKEKHICVLSMDCLDLKEGRTIRDWIKYGKNLAIDKMKKNMEGK